MDEAKKAELKFVVQITQSVKDLQEVSLQTIEELAKVKLYVETLKLEAVELDTLKKRMDGLERRMVSFRGEMNAIAEGRTLCN